MNKIQRNRARARAEAQDKIKKDLRNGVITKQQAKNKNKRK